MSGRRKALGVSGDFVTSWQAVPDFLTIARFLGLLNLLTLHRRRAAIRCVLR